MTCLSDTQTITDMLEYCKFHNVPGWSRHVLVVWPHSQDLVNTLLSYDCIVTIVTASDSEYQRLKGIAEWESRIQTRKVRILYGDPDSYVAAVRLQYFVAVAVPNPASF